MNVNELKKQRALKLKRTKRAINAANGVRKGIKRSARFTLGLFVNLFIVFVIVKAFSYSFHFGYSVFADVAKDQLSKKYVVVTIPRDSSTLEIGKALQDAEIIEDRFVFFAKIRIKNLGGSIQSGEYTLSPAMTYDEIIDVLCPQKDEEEETGQPTKIRSNEVVDTGTVNEDEFTETATEETSEEGGEGGETGGDAGGEGGANEGDLEW